MEWSFHSDAWKRMHGLGAGETGTDNDVAKRGFDGIGTWILGRNMQARLIDDMHLAVRPLLMGSGEHLRNGLDMRALGYEVAERIAGERAMHVFIRKRA